MGAACPLCRNEKHMPKGKPLYGVQVCKKCYYGFANRRQFAFIIDSLVFRIASFGAGLALGVGLVLLGGSETTLMAIAWPLDIGMLALFLCKDGLAGRSLGKLICGVHAIDERTGEPIGLGASFKRNLLLAVPILPLVVAYQLSKGHRWGDGWSHSKVIWNKFADHPIFLAENGLSSNSPPSQEALLAELSALPASGGSDNPYQAPRL